MANRNRRKTGVEAILEHMEHARYQRDKGALFSDFTELEMKILTSPSPSPATALTALTAFPEPMQPTLKAMHVAYWEAVGDADPYDDLLGDLYMQIRSRFAAASLGQYFTPKSIARLKARITLSGWEPSDDAVPERLFQINEPTCGSGVLLLQAAYMIAESRGAEALTQWQFVGNDLDGICARMCAIQMLANAMVWQAPYGELLIRHSDTLIPFDEARPEQIVVHAEHRSRTELRRWRKIASIISAY